MVKGTSFPECIVCPFCGVPLELEPYERYMEQLKCIGCESTITQEDVTGQRSSGLAHCDACNAKIPWAAGICTVCGTRQKRHGRLKVLGVLLVLVVVFAIRWDSRKSEDIAERVKHSIQESIRQNEAFNGLGVVKVALVRERIGKNTYSGYVVFIYEKMEEKVKLSASVDAEGSMSYTLEDPRNIMLQQSFQDL